MNKYKNQLSLSDYLNVRFNHRICGNFIGSPRNSNFKGLPAILNQYEIKLLIDKGICELLIKKGLTRLPNLEDVQTFKHMQNKQLHEQIDLALSKRKEKMLKYLPNIISGKRKKLLKQGVKEEDINLSPEIIIEEEMTKLRNEVQESFVQIPSEHQLNVETTVAQFFDIKPEDEFKHKVFQDLWTKYKGCITLGDSFGCDFLLYPGDPLYFHASHTIHVVGNTDVEPFTLIRTCRLSVIVNKFNLYAYESENGIEYQTIEWEGNVWRNETI